MVPSIGSAVTAVSPQSKHRCNLLSPQLPGIKAAMKDSFSSWATRTHHLLDLCLLVDLRKILMLVLLRLFSNACWLVLFFMLCCNALWLIDCESVSIYVNIFFLHISVDFYIMLWLFWDCLNPNPRLWIIKIFSQFLAIQKR